MDADTICRRCRWSLPPFERALAYGLYADTLRSLLLLLKYEGVRPIAARLGALLALRLAEADGLPREMLVVPVPLHTRRHRERGFNQAGLLARELIAAMRGPRPEWRGILLPKALVRTRATLSQTGLSAAQRRRNLQGVFTAPQPGRLRGRDVLLVDDIYTTGATAEACSKALRGAGAARIWVATVARAQLEEIRFRPESAPGSETPVEQDWVMWDGGGARASVASMSGTA